MKKILRDIYKDGQPSAGTAAENPSIPPPPIRTTPLFVTYPDYHNGQFFPSIQFLHPIMNIDPNTSLTSETSEISNKATDVQLLGTVYPNYSLVQW